MCVKVGTRHWTRDVVGAGSIFGGGAGVLLSLGDRTGASVLRTSTSGILIFTSAKKLNVAFPRCCVGKYSVSSILCSGKVSD